MPKQIEDKKKIILRLRKIQGQVQAIERALKMTLHVTQFFNKFVQHVVR